MSNARDSCCSVTFFVAHEFTLISILIGVLDKKKLLQDFHRVRFLQDSGSQITPLFSAELNATQHCSGTARSALLSLQHTAHVRAQSTIVSRIRVCTFCVPTSQGNTTDQEKPCGTRLNANTSSSCWRCLQCSGHTLVFFFRHPPTANAGLGLEVWTVVGAACLPCQDNSGCESVPDEIAGESERAGEGVKSEQTEQC